MRKRMGKDYFEFTYMSDLAGKKALKKLVAEGTEIIIFGASDRFELTLDEYLTQERRKELEKIE